MDIYHQPVLLQESIIGLNVRRDGTYVDATFGGGGHSRLILEKLGAKGRLFGFDQDEDAVQNLPDDERFTFISANFRYFRRFLRLHGVVEVDGILADLGISSHQIDAGERGFSYRFDAALDMRMNRKGAITAADVLNQYSEEQLQQMFSDFGEVRNAKTLARAVAGQRERKVIRTTGDFLELLQPLARGNKQRYFSQVFQALRIEVNDEINALKEFLKKALKLLLPGGRLVVIAYHSIEDRLVKNFFRWGNFEGTPQKDFYGNVSRPFRLVNKKPVQPSEEELLANPRSRSARLRIAEKV